MRDAFGPDGLSIGQFNGAAAGQTAAAAGTIDASEIARALPGIRMVDYGHLGDGNIHFHVRAPAGMDAAIWYDDVAPQVRRFVDDLVTAAGGSISAEHGIGTLKRAWLGHARSPAEIALMHTLKQALDPQGLLNPGKVI